MVKELGVTLVIVPCGKKKRDYACRADRMYLGTYHRLCLDYARLLVLPDPGGVILILSAKYGLLPLSQKIEPYELRMGQPGSITATRVAQQATELEVMNHSAIVLGGSDYSKICRAVWLDCKTPLAGIGGIGKQLHWLREQLDA